MRFLIFQKTVSQNVAWIRPGIITKFSVLLTSIHLAAYIREHELSAESLGIQSMRVLSSASQADRIDA